MSAIKNQGIDIVNVAPADAPKPNFEAIATAIHQPGPKQVHTYNIHTHIHAYIR